MKDIIFNEKKKEKESPKKNSIVKYEEWHPRSAYRKGYIDFSTHIRLLSNDILKKGDEFFCLGRWMEVLPVRIGTFAGHNFEYRRRRQKYEPNIDLKVYQTLSKTDIIREGDEFWDGKRWLITGKVGTKVDDIFTYRRKL